MKHVYIIDPKSFDEQDQQWKMDGLLDSIGQYFRTQEKPNFTTLVNKYPREAIGLIQKQVDETEGGETVRVYAIGGDDILFDCLNGIIGLPNMELAAVPYGTLNHFIRSFGEGKAELFTNIPSLAKAPVIPTDIIKAGNNYAISGCAVGLTPAVAIKMIEESAKSEKGLNRLSAALWLFLTTFGALFDRDIAARRYTITIDDNDYSGNYSLINISNVPYFGRSRKTVMSKAMPDDGLLEAALFKPAGALSTLASFSKYSRGKAPSNCVRVQAKKITVQSEKPMWIQTDSEYLMDTAITFELIPRAVQIVAVDNLTYQRSENERKRS
jgi:diacylglycerol kinase family enzyme